MPSTHFPGSSLRRLPIAHPGLVLKIHCLLEGSLSGIERDIGPPRLVGQSVAREARRFHFWLNRVAPRPTTCFSDGGAEGACEPAPRTNGEARPRGCEMHTLGGTQALPLQEHGNSAEGGVGLFSFLFERILWRVCSSEPDARAKCEENKLK